MLALGTLLFPAEVGLLAGLLRLCNVPFVFHRGGDPECRLRAHLLLLLDDGHPWSLIVTVLFTSTSIINRWRKRYRQEIAKRDRETAAAATSTPAFVPVAVIESPGPTDAPIDIRLADGHRVRGRSECVIEACSPMC